MRRLRGNDEVGACVAEAARFRRRDPVRDTGVRLRVLDLLFARVGRDDAREALAQENRELAGTAAAIERELRVRRGIGEEIDERARIGRPVGGVFGRAGREMVLEGAHPATASAQGCQGSTAPSAAPFRRRTALAMVKL